MISWIKTHLWQIIGILVAVAAIVATYDIFYRSKPTKELKVITSLPLSLVDINPEAAKDIQVLYKGKPVNNISLFQVQITNTGNQPILETEYSKPLTFSFSQNNEILDASVISSNPSNIGMEIADNSYNVIEMSKTLLNPQDVVSVRFVIKGNSGDILLKELYVGGRVAGVKDISVQSSLEQNSPGWYGIVLSIISGLLIGAIVTFTFVGAAEFYKRLKGREKSPDGNKQP